MAAKDKKSALSEHLKRAILTLELNPGEDLDENLLGESFNLSRTPVREVFRALDGLGYVELRENRGARVAALSHMTLRDFFLAAPMVYGAIIRLAARNAKQSQIDQLKAAQDKFYKALASGSAADRAIANNRFHEITGEMAANIYLMPSFQRLLIDHARIAMTFYQPNSKSMAENSDTARRQHDEIITAIETHNEEHAAQLAEDHWALSRDQIEVFVMPTALSVPLGELQRA